VSVFEPLLLAEMRAVLQKDVEENEGEPALEMSLGNVSRKVVRVAYAHAVGAHTQKANNRIPFARSL
jgi:hypothetical protein